MRFIVLSLVFLTWFGGAFCVAQPFRLPTQNTALFEPGGEERYFVGTVGKPWTSGTFGCVRSGGHQLHEGLDIRCVARDKKGEPTDPVFATADGTVAYVNSKAALSNYGIYVILRHRVDDLEVYSLYAHLQSVQPGLQAGKPVKAGETIGVMGRTANTAEGIDKSRAHVHFELDLFVNDRFSAWYEKTFRSERNDHGAWNGQNFLGIDPRLVLMTQHAEGPKFSLLRLISQETEMFRVSVRARDFPWIKRYPAFLVDNPLAHREGIAGFELVLNFNGIPFQVIPRAASELKGRAKFYLISVNEKEVRKNPARGLVRERGSRWEISPAGMRALDLLTY